MIETAHLVNECRVVACYTCTCEGYCNCDISVSYCEMSGPLAGGYGLLAPRTRAAKRRHEEEARSVRPRGASNIDMDIDYRDPAGHFRAPHGPPPYIGNMGGMEAVPSAIVVKPRSRWVKKPSGGGRRRGEIYRGPFRLPSDTMPRAMKRKMPPSRYLNRSNPSRPIPTIGGAGGYREVMSAVGRAVKRMTPDGAFSRIGTAAGGAMGGAPGAFMGGLLGQGISKLAGFGAYQVNANSLVAGIQEGVQIPTFANQQHATIVRHREFVSDVVVPAVPATFTNTSYALNPGLADTFPWLAGLSKNYDQYQILGMIWEFRSLSGNTATGGALGSVVLATDYDAADSAYATKVYMENSEYATSNKPSLDTIHVIECDPALTHSPIKFLRHTAVPSGKDVRLYDHGKFQIATTGLPGSAGDVIGELWCSYEIAFYKPSVFVVDLAMDHFQLGTSIASSHYLSNVVSVVESPVTGSTLGGTITTSTYTFPPAVQIGSVYLLEYNAYGAATTITTAPAWGTFVGCAVKLMFTANAASQVSAPQAGALNCTRCTVTVAVTITATVASCTIVQGTLPGTSTGGDLWVMEIPPELT